MGQVRAWQEKTYNGWRNHATWNVALWIGNDEGLYLMAREAGNYPAFVDLMRELGSTETPDRVAWNDSGIDCDAVTESFQECCPYYAYH